MDKGKNKPTREQVIKSLPLDLQPIYLQLVAEYRFHCIEKYGIPFVSYQVLADLIVDGWRPTHKAFVDLKFTLTQGH